MQNFNLITEPWLPCITADGRREIVGLRRAFAEAHLLREVADASPLVTIALHRLLLALLHRMFGPGDFDAWRAIWEAGVFDAEAIDAYFAKWSERFFLFDDAHPFYQDAELVGLLAQKPDLAKTSAKLIHELTSGHNTIHFDHSVDTAPRPLDAASAARSVVALQAFAMPGLLSRLPGDSPSANAGSLVGAAVVLARGSTLFQSLMFNLMRYAPGESAPVPSDGHDRPPWERDSRIGEDRTPKGWTDVLTWQSRRILLVPEQDGTLTVRHAVVMRGDQLPSGMGWHGWELMVPFSKPPAEARSERGWQPVGFREGRALWRDAEALLVDFTDRFERPRSLEAVLLANSRHMLVHREVPLDVLGLRNDPKHVATVQFWRHERLPVPTVLLERVELASEYLNKALTLAEQVGRELRGAAWRGAKVLVSFSVDQREGRKPRREDVVAPVVDNMGVERSYWASLEVPFHRLLHAMASEVEADADIEDVTASPALSRWTEELRSAALDSFGEAAGAMEGAGRGLKAAAVAERSLRFGLHKVLNAYREEEQERETADQPNRETEEVTSDNTSG